MKKTLVLICMSVALLFAAEPAANKEKIHAKEFKMSETERKILMEHLHDVLYDAQTKPPLENFLPDGTWSDIDYEDHSLGSNWSPRLHLFRTRNLAHTRPDLALKALDAWCRKGASSPNWWWGCIGIPNALCETVLIIGPEKVPSDLMKKLEPIIRETYIYDPISRVKMTGQNLVWVEEIRFYTGLLFNEPELVQEAYDTISAELQIASEGMEGLQDDFSYHQHGSQNQVGNYGLSFFSGQIKWASVFRGTTLAYPEEQIRMLDLYFMNSLRWTLADGIMDYNFCGRQMWDGAPRNKNLSIMEWGEKLIPLLPEARQTEYRTWFGSPESLTGAAVFPRSACMVYRAPGWRFSLKMCSPKIIGSEMVNSENLQSRYQGDGLAFFGNMKRYAGYPALYDQRRLPGTTEVQDSSSLVGNGIRNTNGYFSVLSDGVYAVAAMRLDARDIQADKVWFCTPAGVVCAGSAICSGSDFPVVTTVDQYRADSEKDFPVEYIGDNIVKRVEQRTGNWKDSFGEFPSKTVSGEVVTLEFHHGVRPQNASYWYSIRKKDHAPQEGFRLETSSERIHALLSGDYVLAAAFEKGTVRLPDGTTLDAEPGISVWTRGGKLLQKADFRVR